MIYLSSSKRLVPVIFEMTGGAKTYHVTLTRDLFLQKSALVYRETLGLIERLLEKHKEDETAVVLQLSHRLTRLPGFQEMLAGMGPVQIIELEPGAGAIGALQFESQLVEETGGGAPFFTSRPLPKTRKSPDDASQPKPQSDLTPTHLLYRHLAYPITEHPLFIGLESSGVGSGICIQRRNSDVIRKHFSIQLRGKDVLLKDYSTDGTFVDEKRVTGSVLLAVGQAIRVGTSGEPLQLIACLVNDET